MNSLNLLEVNSGRPSKIILVGSAKIILSI